MVRWLRIIYNPVILYSVRAFNHLIFRIEKNLASRNLTGPASMKKPVLKIISIYSALDASLIGKHSPCGAGSGAKASDRKGSLYCIQVNVPPKS